MFDSLPTSVDSVPLSRGVNTAPVTEKEADS